MNCPRCGDRIRVASYDGRCANCGNDYLQPYALKCLKEWTFVNWPNGSARVPREGPTQGFATTGRRGPYLFACKRELYQGIYASFSSVLIGSALTHDRKLALFVGTGPYTVNDVWVFDAARVANQATERERNVVDSKRERDVPIYDVSAKAHGVRLGEYLSGRVTLPAAQQAPESRMTTLKQYDGVEV